MNTKHTPGTLEVHTNGDVVSIRASSVALGRPHYYPVPVAVMSCDPLTAPQALANATLFAAAPELLDALRRISDSINGLSGPIPTRNGPEFWAYVKAIADDQISKATA